MYPFFLALHNIARWVALLLGIFVTVRAFLGWSGKREWNERDRKFGAYFGMAMDIQLLLGLLLLFVFSPVTRSAFQNMGVAIQASDVAFFLLEHPFAMLLAVVFAHLGSILARKAPDSPTRFKRAAIWFALAVLSMIIGMPWGRPIFPGLG